MPSRAGLLEKPRLQPKAPTPPLRVSTWEAFKPASPEDVCGSGFWSLHPSGGIQSRGRGREIKEPMSLSQAQGTGPRALQTLSANPRNSPGDRNSFQFTKAFRGGESAGQGPWAGGLGWRQDVRPQSPRSCFCHQLPPTNVHETPAAAGPVLAVGMSFRVVFGRTTCDTNLLHSRLHPPTSL